MSIEEILKAVISAAIAFIVPKILQVREPEPVDTLPWFKWCVAGLVGGVLGAVASALLGFMGLAGRGLGTWAILGLVLGLFQWLALRGYRTVGTWFVLASTLGWMFFLLHPVWGWVSAGLAVGLLQYLSLSKWKGAAWWIVANLIAWPIAGGIGMAILTSLSASDPGLAWVVSAGITGLVGALLLLMPLSRLAEE